MKPKTVLTVDLGGTKILVGEVTRDGQVLSQKRYPSDVTTQARACTKIMNGIKEYLSIVETQGDIQAIAVDVVGRVDSHLGIWHEIGPDLADHVQLSKIVSDEFKLPCYVVNDVTAATVAENLIGIGNVTKNFIYLNIGTGIAGRMVINNQIIVGNDYDAGEFGHVVVDQSSSVKCVCGRYGCVEPLASGLGMSDQAHLLQSQYKSDLKIIPNQRVGADTLFKAYDQADPLAIAVVDKALKSVGTLIMNLAHIANPTAFRVGGGVVSDGWFLSHLQKYLDATTMRFVKNGVEKTSLNPNLIALQGCALFAFEQIKVEMKGQGQR